MISIGAKKYPISLRRIEYQDAYTRRVKSGHDFHVILTPNTNVDGMGELSKEGRTLARVEAKPA
jgi:hypothetical protein